MSDKLRIVTLGGKEFPLGDFTLDQVARTAILLRTIDVCETQAQSAARNTVIHIGLQSGGYDEKFEEFLKIKGVKERQLVAAQLEIGRAIGHYIEEDAAPGEG